MLRKGIAMLLVAVLSLTVFCCPIGQAEADTGESREAATAEKKLESLGVLESRQYDPEAAITRGEFVKLVAKAGKAQATGDVPFADVTKADANYEFISAAYAQGYIFGSGDGKFYPDTEITPTEALIILVRLLRYEMPTRMRGGQTADYLYMANQLRIADGMNILENSLLTVREAMVLVSRALEAHPMKELAMSETEVRYGIDEKTLIQINFGVSIAKGLVEENEFTDLYAAGSSLDAGDIRIAEKIYHSGQTDAAAFLGINAEIYYEEATNIIIYIGENAEENTIVRMTALDIYDADTQTVKYLHDSGTEKKLRLSDTAKLILNGKATVLTEENLKVACGEYVFVDNNKDRVFDVIHATAYSIYTVREASQTRGEVTTEEGVKLVLDPEDDTCQIRISKAGEAADITALAPKTVFLYAESAKVGRVLKDIVICSKEIVGTVSRIGTDEIHVDGAAYPAAASLLQELDAGETGMIILNHYGEAVAFQRELRPVFGYLYGIVTEGFGTVRCKIFTENNRWVTLDVKSRITYNETSDVKATDVQAALGNNPQLIEYLVNTEGMIVSINTPVTGLKKLSPEEEAAVEKNVFRLSEEGVLEYNANGRLLGQDIALSGGTIVFSVPKEGEQGDEEDYRIVSYSEFVGDQSYTVKIYNADKTRVAGVCVVYDMPAIIQGGNQTSMLVVQGQSEIFTNGEVCPAILCYMNGEEIMLLLQDDHVAEESGLTGGLKKNDVIQVGYDARGRVAAISRVYAAANGSGQRFLTGSFSSRTSFIAGNVLSCDTGAGKCLIQYGATNRGVLTLNSGLRNVYIYDADAPIPMTVGSVGDILEGDYVLASMTYSCAREIIIIRN